MGSGLSDENGLFLDGREDEISDWGLRRSRNRRDGGPAAGPGEIRADCSIQTVQFSSHTVIFIQYLKFFGILALEIVIRRFHSRLGNMHKKPWA